MLSVINYMSLCFFVNPRDCKQSNICEHVYPTHAKHLWRQRQQCSLHQWQAVCLPVQKHTLTYVNSSLCTLFSDILSLAHNQTHTTALMSSLWNGRIVCFCFCFLTFSLTNTHTHRYHTAMTSPQTWVTAILLCLNSHQEARKTHDDWLIADDAGHI